LPPETRLGLEGKLSSPLSILGKGYLQVLEEGLAGETEAEATLV
jgi:hypothetical protein